MSAKDDRLYKFTIYDQAGYEIHKAFLGILNKTQEILMERIVAWWPVDQYGSLSNISHGCCTFKLILEKTNSYLCGDSAL